MKILVCGSRYYSNYDKLLSFLKDKKSKYSNLTVITGDARGADTLAKRVCGKLSINCKVYKAYWNLYGKGAGPIRNQKMLDDNPDIQKVVSFHENFERSKGTRNMVKKAEKKGIKVLKFD